jgi:hypothetical protein
VKGLEDFPLAEPDPTAFPESTMRRLCDGCAGAPSKSMCDVKAPHFFNGPKLICERSRLNHEEVQ